MCCASYVHARRRAYSGRDVQLCFAGAASAGGSSVARSSEADRWGAGVTEPRTGCAVRGRWAAVDSAGVHSASASAAGVLFYSFRATAGGADRLQPAVSLVRGTGHGRWGLEPCGVFEEPGAAADVRGGAAFLRRSEPAGEEVYVGRALHRGRHADSGMGFAEEFSSKGWRRAGRWDELPWPEAE